MSKKAPNDRKTKSRFPLSLHRTGQWYKKIRGKFFYLQLLGKGCRSVSEKRWRRWIDHPRERRGPIGELLDFVTGGTSLILLGQYCARSDDLEKAVFYYERAEGLEKYEADAKIRHAQLLVGQGQYTEALPLLRRAQDLKPRDDVQKYLEQVERVAKTR